jgi:hypothetical protein
MSESTDYLVNGVLSRAYTAGCDNTTAPHFALGYLAAIIVQLMPVKQPIISPACDEVNNLIALGKSQATITGKGVH